MNTFEKLLLLALGLMPFCVLLGNALRKISFNFVYATALSTLGRAIFYSLFGGAGNHPHVSSVFLIFFLLWPIALIVTKFYSPWISWTRLWLSVPIMSWFTCTIGVAVDYPVDGAGGGLGMFVTLVASWFYMVPIFAILHLLYLTVAWLRSKFPANSIKPKEA